MPVEDFSRRLLVALVVGAAGPAVAALTLLLIAPLLVAASAPETDGGIVEMVGSLLVGLVIGGMLAAVVACALGATATLFALTATKCPRAYLAWFVCLVLSPMWMAAISVLDPDMAGFVVLVGVVPGAVRLGFGYLEVPSARRRLPPGERSAAPP